MAQVDNLPVGKYIVSEDVTKNPAGMALVGQNDVEVEVAADQTAKDLSPLNDCTGHDIIIDCTNLEYISSSGLRILLNIRKNASAVGSKVPS